MLWDQMRSLYGSQLSEVWYRRGFYLFLYSVDLLKGLSLVGTAAIRGVINVYGSLYIKLTDY